METQNLHFISSEDLIKELADRFSPAVFIGTKDEGVKEGGATSFWSIKGDLAKCYGMCHQLAFIIQTDVIRRIMEKDY